MKTYCLGFLFVEDRVVLTRKNKPEWQAGKLNGVGGKIEAGEEPKQAMIREFKEETNIHCEWWRLFATMIFPEAIVYCFTYKTHEIDGLESVTDEDVRLYDMERVFVEEDVIPNLKWLVPLAFDNDRNHAVISQNVN